MVSSKAAIVEEMVRCADELKEKHKNMSSLGDTVSYWLSYPHSKKVRMLFGRFLLEALHDSQDA